MAFRRLTRVLVSRGKELVVVSGTESKTPAPPCQQGWVDSSAIRTSYRVHCCSQRLWRTHRHLV